jgi:PAS domain S-box-containing protein
MAQKSVTGWLHRVVRNPGSWFILGLLAFLTVLHYIELQTPPEFLSGVVAKLGLSRHAFERILYLAPIVWAGLLGGWLGALVTSVVALACMLPQAVFLSPDPLDSILETAAVFVMGNVVAISFVSLRKEREYRSRLERAQQGLQASEQRYRQLFENAQDAIWLHDLEGNITVANMAASRLTGYPLEEATNMNVKGFLSPEGLELAGKVRRGLLANEPVELPYEQRFVRKDGSEAIVQLATSVVFNDGVPVAFQHIARDVTEQKRMQENLRFYLGQINKAQEEERKRISHELHDETIQALVVLSRKLDALASSGMKLPQEHRAQLEKLWQQVNDIVADVRRLSQDLRPAALDRLGLLSALEWLAADVAKYSGLKIEVKVLGKERRLPGELELVLFRIAQEALRNVWKHAQASEAEIIVEFSEAAIKVTISDNGRGFYPPQQVSNLAREGKLGMAGMQERVQLVGGNLAIRSEPGKGTIVTIELPA